MALALREQAVPRSQSARARQQIATSTRHVIAEAPLHAHEETRLDNQENPSSSRPCNKLLRALGPRIEGGLRLSCSPGKARVPGSTLTALKRNNKSRHTYSGFYTSSRGFQGWQGAQMNGLASPNPAQWDRANLGSPYKMRILNGTATDALIVIATMIEMDVGLLNPMALLYLCSGY